MLRINIYKSIILISKLFYNVFLTETYFDTFIFINVIRFSSFLTLLQLLYE